MPTPCDAETAKVLTNQDVMQMVKAGLPESTVLLSVENAPSAFSTDPADLADLEKSGVTPAVINAMKAKSPDATAQANAVEDERKPVGGTVKVFIPEEWPSAQKELFRQCVAEVNVQRRQDGQDELEAITQGQQVRRKMGKAALGGLVQLGMILTPVAGMAGASQSVAQGITDSGAAKEQYAHSLVMQCMGKHQADEAQKQAIGNMLEAQRQLTQQQIQQGQVPVPSPAAR
jgi:hypothetical protein